MSDQATWGQPRAERSWLAAKPTVITVAVITAAMLIYKFNQDAPNASAVSADRSESAALSSPDPELIQQGQSPVDGVERFIDGDYDHIKQVATGRFLLGLDREFRPLLALVENADLSKSRTMRRGDHHVMIKAPSFDGNGNEVNVQISFLEVDGQWRIEHVRTSPWKRFR